MENCGISILRDSGYNSLIRLSLCRFAFIVTRINLLHLSQGPFKIKCYRKLAKVGRQLTWQGYGKADMFDVNSAVWLIEKTFPNINKQIDLCLYFLLIENKTVSDSRLDWVRGTERDKCNDFKCKALCDNDQVCLTFVSMLVFSWYFTLTCCDLDRVVSTQDSTEWLKRKKQTKKQTKTWADRITIKRKRGSSFSNILGYLWHKQSGFIFC